ncbi:gem-associated protein 7 isoform X1 [Haliaeetus albicilla]|uniref:gem-associated protein 7 isoform X1 n=1 Tax=Haliaeetus albicilla TaxID=8969 RepID=UPI0037E74745
MRGQAPSPLPAPRVSRPERPVPRATMLVPVGVLRLPRGPEGSSRGFNPTSPRFQAFLGEQIMVQGVRANLRQRYLRALGAARGHPTRFYLRAGVQVDAVFGAADVDAVAFQVDTLRTPLGVQAAALLRYTDVLAYTFPLE